MVKIKRGYGHAETKKGKWYQGYYPVKNPEKYMSIEPPYYRSRWEKVFMSFCDLNENVRKWASEYITIEYYDPVKNKTRRYFTDFYVELTNGEVQLIEIKPKRETQPPQAKQGKRKTTLFKEEKTWATNQAKWEAARHLCRKKGWKFVILTEKELGV